MGNSTTINKAVCRKCYYKTHKGKYIPFERAWKLNNWCKLKPIPYDVLCGSADEWDTLYEEYLSHKSEPLDKCPYYLEHLVSHA